MRRWTDGLALPLAALLLLWGAAFSMACRLTVRHAGDRMADESVAGRLLGAARVGLAEDAFTRADDYFHMGVTHQQQTAFTNTLYQRWRADIQPSGHVHVEGYDTREIMPWLELATKMDPNNVSAFLTTAYWLGTAMGKPDAAEEVLLEAQRRNPRDYRVLSERARLLMGRQDDAKAARLLDAGIRLWPSGLEENEETLAELSQMLSYRGFLYDIRGDRKAALEHFARALQAMPQNYALRQRVEALQRGEDLTERDRATWESVFGRRGCAREDHDHHGGGHEEEH